jgi:hypothetical protein
MAGLVPAIDVFDLFGFDDVSVMSPNTRRGCLRDKQQGRA